MNNFMPNTNFSDYDSATTSVHWGSEKRMTSPSIKLKHPFKNLAGSAGSQEDSVELIKEESKEESIKSVKQDSQPVSSNETMSHESLGLSRSTI